MPRRTILRIGLQSGGTSKMVSEQEQKLSVQSLYNQDEGWQREIYGGSEDPHARGVRRRKRYILRMLETLADLTRGNALDVGCGPGAYLKELHRMGFCIHGMDVSPRMLDICRANLNGTPGELHCADVEHIPLPDGVFDLVLCIGVLQYVPSIAAALVEMRRVMTPNGYLVVCFENMMSLAHIDYVFRARLRSFFSSRPDDPWEQSQSLSILSDWFLHHPVVPHHYRLYNPWRFEQAMELFGLSMVHSLTYGYSFRRIRKLKVLPDRLLTGTEVALERAFQKIHVPYLPYSGEFYIGLFKMMPASWAQRIVT